MNSTMTAALDTIEAALQQIAAARKVYADEVQALRKSMYQAHVAERGHDFAMRRAEDVTASIALDRLDVLAASRGWAIGLGPLFEARGAGNWTATGQDWPATLAKHGRVTV